MRLHLLQSIVLYHQHRRQEARALLLKTKVELQSLKIDEVSLVSLIELGELQQFTQCRCSIGFLLTAGFTSVEATMGLRATHGDVNKAAEFITENRKQREEARRKAAAERIFQR